MLEKLSQSVTLIRRTDKEIKEEEKDCEASNLKPIGTRWRGPNLLLDYKKPNT